MGDTGCVIGRYTQLGRQLRKLRHLSGDAQPRESATTLRRATKLACDLACAQAELDDAGEALAALGAQGLLDPELAARLTAWAGTHAAEFGAPAEDGSAASADAIQAARDLDRFLRSLEQGAPAPELPFAPISSVAASTERPDSTTPPPARDFGKLAVLSGVREFPARVKCATLAWHTLHNAIIGAQDPARTE